MHIHTPLHVYYTTCAQVRQTAATLGLHPTLFSSLVARQPELIEVAPPERLATKADALAAALGLRQHAYQIKVGSVGGHALCGALSLKHRSLGRQLARLGRHE